MKKITTRYEKYFIAGLFLTFFVFIFIGSFDFGEVSAMFPFTLSIIGFVLSVVYFIQSRLPANIQKIITNQSEVINPKTEQNELNKPIDCGAYFILLYLTALSILCYLFGFYIGAFVSILFYVNHIKKQLNKFYLPLTIVLTIAFVLIYIFDISFAHNYFYGLLWGN